jgi:hypothetical protein
MRRLLLGQATNIRGAVAYEVSDDRFGILARVRRRVQLPLLELPCGVIGDADAHAMRCGACLSLLYWAVRDGTRGSIPAASTPERSPLTLAREHDDFVGFASSSGAASRRRQAGIGGRAADKKLQIRHKLRLTQIGVRHRGPRRACQAIPSIR